MGAPKPAITTVYPTLALPAITLLTSGSYLFTCGLRRCRIHWHNERLTYIELAILP
ncbi:hypothetical protein [Mycobacterium uberis]|uniref:hypothetical protein n=1 Tax=Mycobacterium uberis TaxID=2162698 RepID=UPI0014030A36|nr:hypothetical protein [Mycobacterium uberis]